MVHKADLHCSKRGESISTLSLPSIDIKIVTCTTTITLGLVISSNTTWSSPGEEEKKVYPVW